MKKKLAKFWSFNLKSFLTQLKGVGLNKLSLTWDYVIFEETDY